MMPPHVTEVRTSGHTAELRGWTFAMIKPEVEVRDAAGQVVSAAVHFHGEWTGEGSQPGAQQFRSVAQVSLPGPGTYRLRMFDEQWTVTV